MNVVAGYPRAFPGTGFRKTKRPMPPLRFPLTLADFWGEETCKSLKIMAPQVGLEPTTLRLTAEFHPLPPTTVTNQVQRNNRKHCYGFARFWLALAALHGQKTDRGERRKKNARCKAGVFQLAESANIQRGRLPCWRLLRGTAYPVNNGPLT